MKYYVYISETKVNMLFDQISPRLRDHLATELKIDLKVFSTTFTEGSKQQTLISKLNVVTDYIDRREEVGSIDKPRSYFRGKLNMRWATTDINRNWETSSSVMFMDQSDQHTLFLAGSTKHVIGVDAGEPTIKMPHSSSPFSVNSLISDISKSEESGTDLHYAEEFIDHYRSWKVYSSLIDIYFILGQNGASQELEFLAKKFNVDKRVDHQVVIGSPIYVALAD